MVRNITRGKKRREREMKGKKRKISFGTVLVVILNVWM